MILFTSAVILLIGIAGIFSNYYTDFTIEIFFGLIAPVLVGYLTVFFMKKYSTTGINYFNKMLLKGFAVKFIFYGAFILTIFTVYSFNPIPFMCSFTVSFISLHIMEALVLKKIQGK
tara:strand:+ start:62 stop:412 length:351 start_codon:yes stop_codon:yes gene_type:complete